MKGVSGNPSGRPKGSTNHDAELHRLEEAAMLLADNVADAIAEAAKAAFVEIGVQQLIPLIEAITDNAKEAVLNGEIGPSSVASLRHWYEDYRGDADNPSGGGRSLLILACLEIVHGPPSQADRLKPSLFRPLELSTGFSGH